MTYKSLEDVAEYLPDNSPRFVLLSYPMTLVCSSLLRACLEGGGLIVVVVEPNPPPSMLTLSLAPIPYISSTNRLNDRYLSN